MANNLNPNFTFVLDYNLVCSNKRIFQIATKFNLLPKNEYHITIIWTKTAEKIISNLSKLNENIKQERVIKLEKLVKNSEFEINLLEEYYYIEKFYEEKNPQETRKTIIQIAKIEWINKFYEELNIIFKENFIIPFWHITLYSNSDNPNNSLRWIWIYSEKQFFALNPIRL